MSQNKARYNTPRRVMPGRPLPHPTQRAVDSRSFELQREREFTSHGQFTMSGEGNAASGLRGFHLNKLDAGDVNPHGLSFDVEGTPRWGFGMSGDTAETGTSNLEVYDETNDERRFYIHATDGSAEFIGRNTSASTSLNVLRLSHLLRSGTAAAGFGTQVQFIGQDDAGDGVTGVEIGGLQFIMTGVTAGAHASYFMAHAYNAGASNERIRLHGDGRAAISTAIGGGSPLQNNTLFNLTKGVQSAPTMRTYLRVSGVADTNVAATTEVNEVYFALGRTLTWATGAIANQRFVRIDAPTLAFNGASTVTNAATAYISGAPIAGANATLTNRYALWIDEGMLRLDGDGTHVFEIGLSNTTAEGAYYGRYPVSIPGVGTKYVSLHDA